MIAGSLSSTKYYLVLTLVNTKLVEPKKNYMRELREQSEAPKDSNKMADFDMSFGDTNPLVEREPIVADWINDLKYILYERVEELHLNSIDLQLGRIVKGQHEFCIWDTDSHRIDFKIYQGKGAKGWLEAERTEEPDPDKPNPLGAA